ncbi:MAG TPA: NAD-dependent malic enzyme [Ktedonobacterales bacterium]|nr:NAD-dependent malic enzyme [Ktedonobacterales bacterium]
MNDAAPEAAPESEAQTHATSLTGQCLLESPLLNKGSAFSEEERRELGLLGLLPPHVAPMEEQLARTYENYSRKQSDLERYIFLASLHDRNEILFYRLLETHIREMSPIVYTPTVGLACQNYSHIYRRPRGLYIAYPDQSETDTILSHAPSAGDTRVIVVTDGERILGLGDLGIGGMEIPIGKLALYTLCAGIHPATTLPIVLDVGTDNEELLRDPLYLGWHHHRIRGQAYDDFIEVFVRSVQRAFPHVLLQWEDFGKGNARRLLQRYQHQLCTFNDDIQGTGAVALAGLLTAIAVAGSRLIAQRIVILGAGSAATGIAEQCVAAMQLDGLTEEQARATIWLIDRHGLVHTGRQDLDDTKRLYAQPWTHGAMTSSSGGHPNLEDVVAHVHPTILIGTAAEPAAFTERIVREMARHVQRPIIFPLSNPTAKSEASPADLVAWTDGRALIATGSPYPDVTFANRVIPIGQCNNMFIFPGMGLGILASGARFVTQDMFVAAAQALSACSPARQNPTASLYPAIEDVREVSRRVAIAVAHAAQHAGVAPSYAPDEMEKRITAAMWKPRYVWLIRQRQHSY